MANGQIVTNSGRLIMLDRTLNETPTRTAPTQFKVGTGTTTPTVSDTDVETPVSIDGDNFKDILSGYPTIDTTAVGAEIRCFLNSLEANSNTLTEYGLVNEDGTRLLFSRTVHSEIGKTAATEVTYIQKFKTA